MKKVIFFLFCLILLSKCQTQISLGQVVKSTVNVGQSVQYQFNATTTQEINFEILPCLNPINWRGRIGSVPTDSQADFVYNFPHSSDKKRVAGTPYVWTVTMNAGQTAFIVISAPSNNTAVANFEIIPFVTGSDPTPNIPADNNIRIQANGGNQYTFTVAASTTNNVEYCLYGHHEDSHKDSDIHGSACWVDAHSTLLKCSDSTTITHTFAQSGENHVDIIVRDKTNNDFATAYRDLEVVSSGSKFVYSFVLLAALIYLLC